jgi:hypothetical protein
MNAFKFMRPGRVAPFTGVRWPEPGEWIEGDAPVALCRSGVHAIQPEALPVWIAEELWRVELEDAETVAPGIVAASRGRLVERIEAWNDDSAREFAGACAAHVGGVSGRAAEYAADARASAEEARADFTTTTVAYMARHAAEAAEPGGFARERAWQADWLAQRLGLTAEI